MVPVVTSNWASDFFLDWLGLCFIFRQVNNHLLVEAFARSSSRIHAEVEMTKFLLQTGFLLQSGPLSQHFYVQNKNGGHWGGAFIIAEVLKGPQDHSRRKTEPRQSITIISSLAWRDFS